MIVNTNMIAAIGVGADGAIPQAEDAQLVIPPTVVPALLFTTPLQIDVPTGTPQELSFLENQENVHTNTAAASATIAILARGLWEVTINASAWFNYDSAGAGADFWSVRLKDFSSTVVHPIISMSARTGLFLFSTHLRMLLQSDTIIERRNPTNGVGQTIQSSVSLIANKIL